MNLVERVTHRNPSPPLTNDERRRLWAGKYYAIPEAVRYGLEAANDSQDGPAAGTAGSIWCDPDNANLCDPIEPDLPDADESNLKVAGAWAVPNCPPF